MSMSHVVSGLVKKKSALLGEADHMKGRLKALERDIIALDRSILLFDPEYDTKSVRTTKHKPIDRLFKHGELTATVLDVLKASAFPLRDIEIAERTSEKLELGQDISANVRGSLYALYNKGAVRKVTDGPDAYLRWEIQPMPSARAR